MICRAEVGSPSIGLEVRGGVHQSLLTVATADGVQSTILDRNLD